MVGRKRERRFDPTQASEPPPSPRNPAALLHGSVSHSPDPIHPPRSRQSVVLDPRQDPRQDPRAPSPLIRTHPILSSTRTPSHDKPTTTPAHHLHPHPPPTTDRNVDEVVTELRGAHQKYKYIEAEIVQRAQRLTFKEPEIKKCLDAVGALERRRDEGEPAVLDFALANHVFARARVDEPSAVCIWLGAGVMLEYGLGEARELLETQLAGCRRQRAQAAFERDYIRDQVTTTEVSIARIYNHGVSLRRKQVARGEGAATEVTAAA